MQSGAGMMSVDDQGVDGWTTASVDPAPVIDVALANTDKPPIENIVLTAKPAAGGSKSEHGHESDSSAKKPRKISRRSSRRFSRGRKKSLSSKARRVSNSPLPLVESARIAIEGAATDDDVPSVPETETCGDVTPRPPAASSNSVKATPRQRKLLSAETVSVATPHLIPNTKVEETRGAGQVASTEFPPDKPVNVTKLFTRNRKRSDMLWQKLKLATKMAGALDYSRKKKQAMKAKRNWEIVKKCAYATIALERLRLSSDSNNMKYQTSFGSSGGNASNNLKEYFRFKNILRSKPEMRTEEELEIIKRYTMHLKFFQSGNMSEETVKEIRRNMMLNVYNFAKEVIFNKGDESDNFYIILKGTISVESYNPKTDITTKLCELKSGDSFGELGLMGGSDQKATRAASCITQSACDFGVISCEVYQKILQEIQGKQHAERFEQLRRSHVLRNLPQSDLRYLALVANVKKYSVGDTLVKQGEKPELLNAFQVIKRGEVKISTKLNVSKFDSQKQIKTIHCCTLGCSEVACDQDSFAKLDDPDYLPRLTIEAQTLVETFSFSVYELRKLSDEAIALIKDQLLQLPSKAKMLEIYWTNQQWTQFKNAVVKDVCQRSRHSKLLNDVSQGVAQQLKQEQLEKAKRNRALKRGQAVKRSDESSGVSIRKHRERRRGSAKRKEGEKQKPANQLHSNVISDFVKETGRLNRHIYQSMLSDSADFYRNISGPEKFELNYGYINSSSQL